MTAFDDDKHDSRDDADDDAREGEHVAPAPFGTFVNAEHDAADRECGENRPGHIEAMVAFVA